MRANGLLDCYARQSYSMLNSDLLTVLVTLALISSASWSAKQLCSPKQNLKRSPNKNLKRRRARKRRKAPKQN